MITIKMEKTLTILGLSILTLVMLVGFASATITFSNVPTLSQTGTSAQITISSDQNESIVFSGLNSITFGGKTITFTPLTLPITLVANTPQILTINYSVQTGFVFELGQDYSTILTATGIISPAKSQTLSFEESDFCAYNNDGVLDLSIEEIKVVSGFGDDEEFWYLGDEVEVEVKVESDSYDIENIEVEWCLYDTENKKCVLEDTEDDFDLDDGDDETLVIKIDLDPEEFEDSESYKLYVKATGDINDEDSTSDGNETCISDSQSIDVNIDKDFVVLENIEVNPETVQCEGELHVSADVWNIGSDDQNDVYVIIYNKALGINEQVDIGDIDSFENENLEFTFSVPEDTEEKAYDLLFQVYDEDDDLYENDEDDKSEFTQLIKVEGSCGVSQPSVTVSAELASEAKAGEKLLVKATVTNTGEELTPYNLLLTGYSEWASSAELDSTNLALGAGKSQEVTITFAVNEDAVGVQSFDIEVMSGTDVVLTQPVTVDIQEASGFSWPTGSVISGDNWYLWGIGALNVILVIIIIIVAIRVAKS